MNKLLYFNILIFYYNMKIYNPIINSWENLTSKKGLRTLKKYIIQLGSSLLSTRSRPSIQTRDLSIIGRIKLMINEFLRSMFTNKYIIQTNENNGKKKILSFLKFSVILKNNIPKILSTLRNNRITSLDGEMSNYFTGLASKMITQYRSISDIIEMLNDELRFFDIDEQISSETVGQDRDAIKNLLTFVDINLYPEVENDGLS